MSDERYVALAEVARPHGLAGELRLRVYNTDSDLLLGRPHIRLASEDGEVREGQLVSIRRVPGGMLARLASVDTREAAEQMRGIRIEVRRTDLSPAEPGELYHCDLEGCRVMLQGADLGVVKRVACYPTCDALVVARPGAKDLEVPLHDDFVASVDTATACIVVRTVEGLE